MKPGILRCIPSIGKWCPCYSQPPPRGRLFNGQEETVQPTLHNRNELATISKPPKKAAGVSEHCGAVPREVQGFLLTRPCHTVKDITNGSPVRTVPLHSSRALRQLAWLMHRGQWVSNAACADDKCKQRSGMPKHVCTLSCHP